MTYNYWATKLEESITDNTNTETKQASVTELYDIKPQDGLDIVNFLKTVLNDTEYKEVVDKVFDKPLKPIEIPSIYSIPDKTQAKYQELGYRLVKKSSGGNS